MKSAVLALALCGCTVVQHFQVLPTLSKDMEPGCCVAYAEIPPSTRLSVAVNKTPTSTTVKLGAKWRF